MEITRKFKEVSIDILVRVAQIFFVAFVITPFITKELDIMLLSLGGVFSVFCIFVALIISSTVMEVK